MVLIFRVPERSKPALHGIDPGSAAYPASHALIVSLFPSSRRAFALAI
jgi:hypothetical protein